MNYIKRLISYLLASLAILLLAPALASAHVIVTPNQAGVAQELVYSVSSPNERETPITKVVLDIPDGVTDVTPTIKDGWTITTTTKNDDVTSITWSDGQIPVGQRADFSFGATAPNSTTTLQWKAYQTYADGTVVHWDQTPAGSDDATGNAGPYSETKIVNDLSSSSASTDHSGTLALIVACMAVILALAAWLRTFKKS